MSAQDDNHFARFRALGYLRLVPIVPPGAPLSEKSSLYRRLHAKHPTDERGKSPGVKWPDGSWSGYNWLGQESTEDDCDRWHEMGANVGIRTGSGLALIDADTLSPEHAKTVLGAVERHCGTRPPVRVGRYPKAGYLVRTDDDFRYARIEFGERNERGLLTDRVEILSEGRQFVAHGIHPGTGKPYRWPQGVPALADVPFVPGATLMALLADLAGILPCASQPTQEGAAADVDQATLRGDWSMIEKAVRATPNTSDLFPTREAWRDYGYAIKAAAGPDREADALALFQDWSERWADGENDPDYVAAEWGRFKPPFKRGANWLYELASAHGGGKFSIAEQWFEPVTAEAKKTPDGLYDLLSIDDLLSLPDPKFLIDRHVPEGSLGFLYGDPGTGKSFIALDWALHLAYSKPDWFGDAIDKRKKSKVIYIAGEGVSGIKNRIAAWKHTHQVGRDEEGQFFLIRQSVNFMSDKDVIRLAETLRYAAGGPVDMIVVDTVSRSMPGSDENFQKEMTIFVQTCDHLKNAFGCAVVGVHHANKAGDMRGSTVLTGAGDFVFKLERKKGKVIGHLRCEKQKDAPDGWVDNYRFDVVTLGEKTSSLVIARCGGSDGESATLTPEITKSVLAAIQAAWDAGEPWSMARNAKCRAAEKMVREFGFDMESAEDTLRIWIGSGTLEEDVRSKKSRAKGLRVAAEADETSVEMAEDGVFD